jgi:hypothetical protein
LMRTLRRLSSWPARPAALIRVGGRGLH